MTATITLEHWNAGSDGSPAYTSLPTGPPNFRFKTDDTGSTLDSNNPIPIPASSFNYSFWAHIGMNLGGTFTQVSNIRHYCDGSIGWTFGTGGELRRGNRDSGDKGCPTASYDKASGTTGTTGDDLATHTYFSGQTTKTANINSDTSGSPATIDTSTYTTAGRTKAIVLQVKVASDATQGSQTSETLTWLYDEI